MSSAFLTNSFSLFFFLLDCSFRPSFTQLSFMCQLRSQPARKNKNNNNNSACVVHAVFTTVEPTNLQLFSLLSVFFFFNFLRCSNVRICAGFLCLLALSQQRVLVIDMADLRLRPCAKASRHTIRRT